MSPYEAVYGVKPNLLPGYHPGESSVESVDELMQQRSVIQQQFHINLQVGQQRMTRQADLKRQDKEYAVGDWVWVKLHHFKQGSVAKRLNFKLSKHYYGPFKVSERIGAVAYKLELPSDSRIYNVFHVALLKTYHGQHPMEPRIAHDEVTI